MGSADEGDASGRAPGTIDDRAPGEADDRVRDDARVATGAAASDGRRGTGAVSVAKSVGAAMIGVQSRKNRERDFTEGKPIHFVIGGVIGTLVFLLVIWLLVQYLIATS